MATLPKPAKPLKILTIDGGGLQGISSLLILDTLLKEIAQSNQVRGRKPRPCDVFDVIAGIGSGGWLALLLGRFQMDVSAALAEWYNLIDCIAPRSRAEELRMRLKKHSYYDTDRLVDQIEQLADFYETDRHMFFTPPEGTRCKHVFVSALKTNSKGKNLGYNLFRTYDGPEGANVREDLPDPRTYKISHAFGVTGAAKYFTPPWKETSASKAKSRFLDIQFPSPHNITELALDEMWRLYGKDVAISVVVNIGPGIPNASDCKDIARRFSWGRKTPTMDSAVPTKAHKLSVPADYSGREASGYRRYNTFGSEPNVDIEEKLKRDEDKIEEDIKGKLRRVYGENAPPYHRLAPITSAPRTAQNDTSSPKTTFDATQKFLNTHCVLVHLEQVGQSVLVESAC
ncbi:MAG: hypothetical protein LQ338_007463 [Usnochroma carphineum]|nr:MAG: hypothetical protein LQ338_007463 [Usnochroma carphineum]